jgi:hypothetical protein
LILAAGTVIAFYAVLAPGAPWLARIGCGVIAVIGLLFTFILLEIMRTVPIWGERPPRSQFGRRHENGESPRPNPLIPLPPPGLHFNFQMIPYNETMIGS